MEGVCAELSIVVMDHGTQPVYIRKKRGKLNSIRTVDLMSWWE